MIPNRTPALIALLLAAFAAGCGMNFDPPSYLDDLRVLAVESDPLEVGPGEAVTLRPRLYLPTDQTLTAERWTFCPFHLGPQANYACALPACVRDLPIAADGAVTADPLALALECLAGQAPDSGGELPAEMPEQVDMLFSYTVASSSGAAQKTVVLVPVYPFATPTERNRPPIISAVLFDGQAAQVGVPLAAVAEDQELAIEIQIDPDSLDSYVDESGRELTEDAIFSLYATAGRFDADRLDDARPHTTWKAEELLAGQDAARFFIVARDLRGGQTVAGPFDLSIGR